MIPERIVSTPPQTWMLSKVKPSFLIAFGLLVLILTALGRLEFCIRGLLAIVAPILAGIALMTRGAQLDRDRISVGFRRARGRFIAKKTLRLDEIGRIIRNEAGDIILFRKAEQYRWPQWPSNPGHIGLSHDLVDLQGLLRRIVEVVEPGAVDPSVQQFMSKGN